MRKFGEQEVRDYEFEGMERAIFVRGGLVGKHGQSYGAGATRYEEVL